MIPTLQSLQRMLDHTARKNISTELVVILDDSDAATRSVLERAQKQEMLSDRISIIEVSHKNLSRSRLSGIEASQGKYVALLDGDDLYSRSWISEALSICRRHSEHRVVCHPEINVYFGADRRIWRHPDELRDGIPYEGLSRLDLSSSMSPTLTLTSTKASASKIGIGIWRRFLETSSTLSLQRLAISFASSIELASTRSQLPAKLLHDPRGLPSRFFGVRFGRNRLHKIRDEEQSDDPADAGHSSRRMG